MDLGVYIHFPFCRTRCPYCDFVTTDREDLTRLHRAGYVATLLREWELLRATHPAIVEAKIRSVFMGGGTPNLMTPEETARLLGAVRATADEDSTPEVTMEMNPGISERDTMRTLRDAGVNRASIGVQSTHDPLLRTLGRDHSAADARRAFDWAREADFDSVNVDLIFAVPGQTLDDWRQTLGDVIAWAPDHISAYNLTAKDQTPLAAAVRRGEVDLPDEDTAAAMFELAHDLLGEAGFEHYEISNYARPGRRSVHNADVWAGIDYAAIGLGAHSCLEGERFANTAAWEEYHRAIGEGRLPRRRDARDDDARRAERLYLDLRTAEGTPLVELAGSPQEIEGLTDEGLAVIEGNRLRLTPKGWMVCDAIVEALL